jgi:hypothetical protein
MRKTLLLIPVLAVALAGSGTASVHAAKAGCPSQAGWQKLANRIHADVYCPSWLPDPLTAQIDGPWNNINSVSQDRSYLIGFIWQEKAEEIHINLRGYPGVTRIPTCRSIDLVGGKKRVTYIQCFADPRGQKTIGGVRVTVYTVNQDADQWHVLYAWRHNRSLYTLSEHIAPPYTLPRVVQNLNRMMSSLVLVRPAR